MAEAGDERLYTLSEISQRTKISMPTLQRYKKLYQNRIPAVGSGRKQRYPESAIPVFNEIKGENVGRRGRPRKEASEGGKRRGRRPGRPAAEGAPARGRRGRGTAQGARGARGGRPAAARGGRRASSGGSGLLTLTQVSEMTGISYPTLVRYVRLYSDRLPHEGKGRARRFRPEAVPVFRELRQQSGRGGRKPGSGRGGSGGRAAGAASNGALAGRLRAIEKSQQGLEKRFKSFVKSLQRLLR